MSSSSPVETQTKGLTPKVNNKEREIEVVAATPPLQEGNSVSDGLKYVGHWKEELPRNTGVTS